MDSKRMYKKVASIFWLMLATLPFWYTIIYTIAHYLIHTDNLTLNEIQTLFNNNTYQYNFNLINTQLQNYTPQPLSTAMQQLVQAFDNNINVDISNAMTWFCWTYFIHLLVDLIVWLPRILHSFIERRLSD